MATRNLSIMFTDIKGFTERTSGDTRQGMTQFLSLHERLLVPVFRYFKGTIVKTIGDAFLVYFESPTDAVLCGVTIQEVLRQHNALCKDDEKLDVRVAINVGDVELLDKDVLGEAVNIAARVESIAEAGEVFFTEAVYQTMNRREAPSAEIGERIFKGIPHPIRVYKVINDPKSDLAQTLTENVNLSASGPIIKGIRHGDSASVESKILLKLMAFIVVLALAIVGVWQLIPSANDKTMHSAQELIAQHNFGQALTLLDPALRAHPTETRLITLAYEAGQGYLQNFIQTGEYQQGLAWLKTELQTKPYLESLRPELAVLDTRTTILALKTNPEYTNHYYPKPLEELLLRYPNNINVRYIGAQTLETHWLPTTALWYYEEALKAGLQPKDHIFTFCTTSLTSHSSSYGEQQRARKIMADYYPKRQIRWAREVMDQTNVQAIRNGWLILSEKNDPIVERPYYQEIVNLVQNTANSDDLDKQFAGEEDETRHRQIRELHKELITTYPRYVNYGKRIEALKVNLQRLEDNWKK